VKGSGPAYTSAFLQPVKLEVKCNHDVKSPTRDEAFRFSAMDTIPVERAFEQVSFAEKHLHDQ
jgi:hypothetical protein